MNARLIIMVCIGLLRCISSAQVSSTPPRNWKSDPPVNFRLSLYPLKLSNNSPDVIRQELLDTNTVRLIAKSAGLSDADLATMQVVREPGTDWVQVYHRQNSQRASTKLSDHLRRYVQAREEGHTRAYILAAFTNRVALSTVSDRDLRAIGTNLTLVPLSWLKRVESGTTTNKAGAVATRTISITEVDGKFVTNETTHIPKVDEVCHWVSYVLIDGEVAWQYTVRFKADGSLDHISDSRCDAKEYDPKYLNVIKEVENDVDAQMKRDGTLGQFGSVHTYWRLKKEKLKARSIDWRSPSELNPNTIYD